jgi:hypothetical protein
MPFFLVPTLLTCGPAALSALAFVRALKEHRSARIQRSALWAVGGVVLITAYAAYTFVHYTLKPPPDSPPPWQDPETLDLAMLFFLAPVGLIFAVIAGVRGASKRVVAPLIVALLVLFLVGLLEGASV